MAIYLVHWEAVDFSEVIRRGSHVSEKVIDSVEDADSAGKSWIEIITANNPDIAGAELFITGVSKL